MFILPGENPRPLTAALRMRQTRNAQPTIATQRVQPDLTGQARRKNSPGTPKSPSLLISCVAN